MKKKHQRKNGLKYQERSRKSSENKIIEERRLKKDIIKKES